MPSIRSLLTGLTLTTLALLQTTSALPAGPKDKDCGKTPTLPLTGAATELPATTLKLAYIAVGRGIQNYTCTGPGATPTLLGAVATLYDATALAKKDLKALHSVPAKAAYKTLPAKNKSFDFPAPIGKLPVLGDHFFDAAGVPVFNLNKTPSKAVLFAAKKAGVKAPATADKGPSGTGAVDWLFLDQNTAYKSVALKQVYRVTTAGGVGPVCTSAGVESQQYATEYWFYN